MRAAILTALRADAAFAAALPGGLFDAAEVGVISRTRTPAAFDATTRELRACALLRLPADQPAGPLPTSARLEATLYLYEPAPGRAGVEAARKRAYAVLHRQRLTPSSGGAWELAHAGDVLDAEDDALAASLIISRFTIPIRKG